MREAQKPLIALGVAILALSLIADEGLPRDMARGTARKALKLLAEKYGYTPENT